MKRKTFLITAILAVICFFMLPEKVSAADGQFEFVGCTDDSVTVSYDITKYLTGSLSKYYEIHSLFIVPADGPGGKIDENNRLWETEDIKEKGSVTLNGLGKGYVNFFYLFMDSTIKQTGNRVNGIVHETYVNTTPKTPKQSSFGIMNIGGKKPTVDFRMDHHKSSLTTSSFGMQIELCNAKGKRLGLTDSAYKALSIKRDTVYKYRARLSFKNTSTGETFYGSWSGWKFFDLPSVKISSSKKGIKLIVKKAANVKSYTVYVGRYSEKKKTVVYKKTKTIKTGSKSKYTVYLTKYGKSAIKKGKIYYVRVVPNIKVGSKTVVSGASDYGTGTYMKK